jgi:polar amino acid transport system permease protein
MGSWDFGPVLTRVDQLALAALVSLWIAAAGLASALAVGGAVALLANSRVRIGRLVARVYVEVVRGTPLLIQIFALFYVPASLGIQVPNIVSGITALAIYFGAYTSEVIRGGLASVPQGQIEAGRALGMSGMLVVKRVVLPQALANVIPPLTGQAASLIKVTSLLSAIAVNELTLRGAFVMVQTRRPLETWTVIAIVYLIMNTALLIGARVVEARLRRHLHRPGKGR